MDFSLNQEQQMTRKMVRDFAQKEIAPVIKEYDRRQEPIPFTLKRMGELGLLGIAVPERWGGSGADTVLGGSGADTLIFYAYQNQYVLGGTYVAGGDYTGTLSGGTIYDDGTQTTLASFSGYDNYDGGNGTTNELRGF